jgi:MFS family permease
MYNPFFVTDRVHADFHRDKNNIMLGRYSMISMRYYLPYMLQNTSAFHSGWVVSTTLAGATVGSFTGGALADKLGRTRTFILDAIPLAVGAFLRCVF